MFYIIYTTTATASIPISTSTTSTSKTSTTATTSYLCDMSWAIKENVFDGISIHLFEAEKKLDGLVRCADLFHPFDLVNSFLIHFITIFIFVIIMMFQFILLNISTCLYIRYGSYDIQSKFGTIVIVIITGLIFMTISAKMSNDK